MFHYFLPILTAKRDCLGAGNSVAENIEFFFFFFTKVKNGYYFSTIKALSVGNKMK